MTPINVGLYYAQAYQSAYKYYFNALQNNTIPMWDYVFITESNRKQKYAFEQQIKIRKNILPKRTKFVVISDKDDVRVGSGGSTLMVIDYLNQKVGINSIDKLKILVIHSGGDAQRIPQYSVPGKLFAPMPHELPNKSLSTLFDEIFITSARIASRIRNGMVILSGDVLLLFNPLFLNCYQDDAYALTFEENPKIAVNHGVYVSDRNDFVTRFLHKQKEKIFKQYKAYNINKTVNIDTGLIIFSPAIIKSLFKLIDTKTKYNFVISNRVRLSLYGDLIYPLAKSSSLERFYQEKAEGTINKDLLKVRNDIWHLLHQFRIKLLKVKPGKFLHFGTSRELLNFYDDLKDYKSLGWMSNIHSFSEQKCYCYNSYISPKAKLGKHCYIENSSIGENVVIGDNVIISNIDINNITIPSDVVISGVKLTNELYVVRVFGIDDNPKLPMQKNNETSMWEEGLYPACKNPQEALEKSLSIYKNNLSKKANLFSLKHSFEDASVNDYLKHTQKMFDYVNLYHILSLVKKGADISKYRHSMMISLNKNYQDWVKSVTPKIDVFALMRFYIYLADFVDCSNRQLLIDKGFKCLADFVSKNSSLSRKNIELQFSKNRAIVRLPLRINFAGGWTDTPPYCYEHGGTVLNAPILLNNQLPVYVEINKIPQRKIIIDSTDINSYREFTNLEELQSLGDPFDSFVLHKSCLVAAGIIPPRGSNLTDILNSIGSGLYIKTEIINVPKGSGLGTSSILCLGLLKCLYNFFNYKYTQDELLKDVLIAEQLMSTGGGWQDQAGGIGPNFKIIKSHPGVEQKLEITPVKVSAKTIRELDKRFMVIYTGQRRLAKNILRNVMGDYIQNDTKIVGALNHIKNVAENFKIALEKGDLNLVGRMMDEQWEYSKIINKEASNGLIDNILMSIDDLISGRMICGAGGGGFLQVLLNKNVTKSQLRKRLDNHYKDLNINAYDVKFYLEVKK